VEQANYGSNLYHLGEISGQIVNLNVPAGTPLVTEVAISLANVQEKSGNMNQNLVRQQEKFKQAEGNSQATYTRDLIDLRYEMELLKPENFSYTERFEVNAGSFYLQPTFYPIDSLGNRTNGQTTSLAPVKVRVRGGLRISSSVGISLGQYFDAPREYAVKDGIVVGNEIDRFVPIANTLLHFHPYGDGRMVLGGAFGVGIPLSSSDAEGHPLSYLAPASSWGIVTRSSSPVASSAGR
jgi:hypothetical protein